MTRDMNLIREILLQIENSCSESDCCVSAPEGYSAEETEGHLLLLLDAGFIEAEVLEAWDGTDIRVKRMTWDGHDFLEAIRPPQVWDQVEKQITEMGSAAFEIVKGLAIQEAQKLLP